MIEERKRELEWWIDYLTDSIKYQCPPTLDDVITLRNLFERILQENESI